MNHIHVKKFAFAVGATSGLLYLGCALLMLIIGREGTASFFGTLIHGLDVSGIIRMDMPAIDAVSGVIQSFVLGWLIGASVAAIYNASIGEMSERPNTDFVIAGPQMKLQDLFQSLSTKSGGAAAVVENDSLVGLIDLDNIEERRMVTEILRRRQET